MSTEDQIAELEAIVAQQREQIAHLVARIHELEAQLAQVKRASHTSAKPPSRDGLRRKTKSLRTPSGKKAGGKKAGGQLGHRGETLHLVAPPDAVVEHRPAVCAHCQAPLAEAAVVGRERRQVQELPPVRRPRPTRRPSGRKPGGPPGDRGQRLALVETPDSVQTHHPATCAQGQQPLEGVPGTVVERRQYWPAPRRSRLAVGELEPQYDKVHRRGQSACYCRALLNDMSATTNVDPDVQPSCRRAADGAKSVVRTAIAFC